MRANSTCRELTDEAKNHMLLNKPQSRIGPVTERFRPRRPLRPMDYVYAVGPRWRVSH